MTFKLLSKQMGIKLMIPFQLAGIDFAGDLNAEELDFEGLAGANAQFFRGAIIQLSNGLGQGGGAASWRGEEEEEVLSFGSLLDKV